MHGHGCTALDSANEPKNEADANKTTGLQKPTSVSSSPNLLYRVSKIPVVAVLIKFNCQARRRD